MTRRPMTRTERLQEAIAKTRFGGWFAVTIGNPVDRRLLRWSKGRVGVFPGRPVGLLETVGARSGAPRDTPLLYLEDGERVVLVASKAGATRHPAWYHNLRAHPDVAFTDRRGNRREYRAHEAAGEERQRLWEQVNDLYSGYETYQGRTGGRTIPVMVLERR